MKILFGFTILLVALNGRAFATSIGGGTGPGVGSPGQPGWGLPPHPPVPPGEDCLGERSNGTAVVSALGSGITNFLFRAGSEPVMRLLPACDDLAEELLQYLNLTVTRRGRETTYAGSVSNARGSITVYADIKEFCSASGANGSVFRGTFTVSGGNCRRGRNTAYKFSSGGTDEYNRRAVEHSDYIRISKVNGGARGKESEERSDWGYHLSFTLSFHEFAKSGKANMYTRKGTFGVVNGSTCEKNVDISFADGSLLGYGLSRNKSAQYHAAGGGEEGDVTLRTYTPMEEVHDKTILFCKSGVEGSNCGAVKEKAYGGCMPER